MTITLPPPLGTFAAIFAGASTGGLIVIAGVALLANFVFQPASPSSASLIKTSTVMYFPSSASVSVNVESWVREKSGLTKLISPSASAYVHLYSYDRYVDCQRFGCCVVVIS